MLRTFIQNRYSMSLQIITDAINTRKVIRYQYNKVGEPSGERIGHPYAVFIFTSKAGAISTKVHIVQTDGDSKSVIENPFPSFRMYNIEDLTNVRILENIPSFGEPFHELYRPESPMYIDVIVKI